MRNVTTRTLTRFTGTTGTTGMTFQDVTVLLVRMTAAQVQGWKWIAETPTEEPLIGWEVRDTTGALLGVALPLGHLASRIHTEWYDPQADDFMPTGRTPVHVLSQAIARVLDERTRRIGPVPAGDPADHQGPRYLPTRAACWAGTCPQDCPDCEMDHQRRDAEHRAAPIA